MNDTMAVVISTYNNPDYLNLVLQAYEQQTDKKFHIYIADDGSSEATQGLIKTFQMRALVNIQHIWHEDVGFRKARIHNLVFQQLKEGYVILTDGDCIPMPEMVAVHRQFSEKGVLMSGSRILLSQSWTQQLLQRGKFSTIHPWMSFSLRWHQKINRCLPLWIPTHTSSLSQKLSGIHGCHIALYREDLLRVNGYDESFEGWGREDSDLIARLFHAGVMRKNLRGTPVLHLWHEENSRHHLEDNDVILQQCLSEKRQRAIQGIDELADD
ncbi:MAG: glycosyltransferase [Zetaproteobacteria bacterium]|nr:glycosyltransferase [Zetaproteobacteria bacterium]